MTVIYRLEGNIAVVTLNDPTRHNAMSRAMVVGMNQALDRADNEGARGIVIGSVGPSFCAGANIDDLRSGWMEGRDTQTDPVRFFQRLATDRRPTIAAVQGIAAGGGLELTLACDLVVAGPLATFVAPELGHGVVPPFGVAALLGTVGQHRALDLILTRRRVAVEEALRIGLATQRSEGDDVIAEAIIRAEEIVGRVPPGALAVVKRCAQFHLGLDWERIFACSAEVPQDEWKEGLDAFVEKRRPNFERFWSQMGKNAQR